MIREGLKMRCHLTALLAACCLCLSSPNHLPTQTWEATILVGPAANADQPGPLHAPFGVDLDAAGNLFIVELEGGRVHRLSAEGNLTTIAGGGRQGYSGDGGPARQAAFNGMHNVAVTPRGDLYIADSWNHCIRKIDAATGVITTFAGTGQSGFAGDGGPAREAQFDYLMCVTFNADHSRLYCADLQNFRIRVIDMQTGRVATVAGNGQRGVPRDGDQATASPLVDPRAVAVDSSNNVYVLERSGHALRVVTPDGVIRTVAGTGQKGDALGPALSAQFSGPKHLAVDQRDDVYIADEQNARIVKYSPSSHTVTAVVGRGVREPAVQLSRPHGVCFDAHGALIVVDSGNHRLVRLQRQ
jgi:DNA-binding beta-propeller fold protein YncE